MRPLIFFVFLTRQDVKTPDCLIQYQMPGKAIITSSVRIVLSLESPTLFCATLVTVVREGGRCSPSGPGRGLPTVVGGKATRAKRREPQSSSNPHSKGRGQVLILRVGIPKAARSKGASVKPARWSTENGQSTDQEQSRLSCDQLSQLTVRLQGH